jgi:hypothetical protein
MPRARFKTGKSEPLRWSTVEHKGLQGLEEELDVLEAANEEFANRSSHHSRHVLDSYMNRIFSLFSNMLMPNSFDLLLHYTK